MIGGSREEEAGLRTLLLLLGYTNQPVSETRAGGRKDYGSTETEQLGRVVASQRREQTRSTTG